MPNNLRPNLATAKKSILDFAKSQIPSLYLFAIDSVLSPCCDIFVTNFVVSCDPDNAGNYIVVITLSSSLNLRGTGMGTLGVGGMQAIVNGNNQFQWNDTNSITLKNVSANSGDQSVNFTLLLGVGGIVSLLFTPDMPDNVITFPTC